jgi:hypothetical protein
MDFIDILKQYEILVNIKSDEEIPKEPYNIYQLIKNSEIKPTFKEINLKYIKGQKFLSVANDKKNEGIRLKKGGKLIDNMVIVFDF